MNFLASISSFFQHVFARPVQSPGRVPPQPVQPTQPLQPSLAAQLFVISPSGLRLRKSPQISDGNAIAVLPYGQAVTVISVSSGWAQVQAGSLRGWASSQYLADALPAPSVIPAAVVQPANPALPAFVIGMPNHAADSNTLLVRAAINDQFGDGKAGIDLQCTEYAQYKVQQAGLQIKWPVQSGRNGGQWGKIFSQYGMYSVSNQPSGGAAICLTAGISADPAIVAVGHVAYVEQVFTDGTIKISEANWPNSGKYNERLLHRADWQGKYQAQFVSFVA